MTLEEFDHVRAALHEMSAAIQTSKRPGYTIGSSDVLANFKRVAERTGVSVGQVWSVYFLKHVDAITSIVCRPDLPVSEDPIGRFADAINYLELGWAIVHERAPQAEPASPIRSGVKT